MDIDCLVPTAGGNLCRFVVVPSVLHAGCAREDRRNTNTQVRIVCELALAPAPSMGRFGSLRLRPCQAPEKNGERGLRAGTPRAATRRSAKKTGDDSVCCEGCVNVKTGTLGRSASAVSPPRLLTGCLFVVDGSPLSAALSWGWLSGRHFACALGAARCTQWLRLGSRWCLACGWVLPYWVVSPSPAGGALRALLA